MKDFSWKYFAMTGDLDAYMLYKQVTEPDREADDWEEEETFEVPE